MKEDNLIKSKSYDFAIRIIDEYKCLCSKKKEYVLSKQLLRSGTSIGANIHEAINAQSKKDFIAKLYIALKEASETEYWINLLIKTEYIDNNSGNILLTECLEIKKIIYAIIKTTKSNQTP